jgi:long-chain fatty acid transport protein
MKIPTPTLLKAVLLAAVSGSLASSAFATDGYFVQGFGAVNSALGGAATAGNDQDLIGSIYKNPATGVLFADRTGSIVFGDIIPSVETDSSITALGLHGSSDSTINGVPYLSLMSSWKSSNPNVAFFAGAVSEAGLSFHSATSTTNPIFMPQAGSAGNPYAPYGFGGFGDVRSTLYVIRIPVGLAGSSPDGWSWGFALAPSIGRNLFSPAAFAAPGIAPDTLPVYGAVQQEDIEFGLGAQGGLRCQVDKDLSLGVSLSSPTWFHSYSWTIHDPSGAARTVSFMMDRPLTAQVGMNYAAAASTHIVADLGYIAYGETNGFKNSGFKADGSMAGLGWKDSYTFELGVQQAVTSDIVVRAGYNYCSDPIPAAATFYNVGSPLSIENHLSVGTSVTLAPHTTLDISYTHGFSHSQTSGWYNPKVPGAVPGSSITSKISGNEFAIGTTFRF